MPDLKEGKVFATLKNGETVELLPNTLNANSLHPIDFFNPVFGDLLPPTGLARTCPLVKVVIKN